MQVLIIGTSTNTASALNCRVAVSKSNARVLKASQEMYALGRIARPVDGLDGGLGTIAPN